MKSGDITGVTGVPELTWCYNRNTLARAKQTSILWVDASQKLHHLGGRDDDEGGSLGLLDIMAD